LWKLPPLLEIRKPRGFPQRLGKRKTLSTVPTRPTGIFFFKTLREARSTLNTLLFGPKGGEHLNDLAFAQLSRQIKPLKGDYFRIAKDVALKAHEEELKENVKVHAPGTAFSVLLEELARLSEDPKCTNLEVTFLSNKLGEDGQKVVHDGKYVAEIRSVGIHVFSDETRAFLKQEFDRFPVLSLLVLWTRYGAGKLGILRLQPVRDDDTPVTGEDQEWEGKAIAAYLHRHDL